MTFKLKVKVNMTFSTKKAYNSAMLMVWTLNLVEMLVLTSRWQRARSPRPLILKSLITWQCLGIGPSNLEGMLVLTSKWHCRPRWLSRMPRPTGDQEVAGSTPIEVGNILSWRLITKYFIWSFFPFCWFKKGSCQFLAKACAQYLLTT